MQTKLIDILDIYECTSLDFQNVGSDILIKDIQDLTLKELVSIAIPLMHFEGMQYAPTETNLCVNAIRIIWKRASEKETAIF